MIELPEDRSVYWPEHADQVDIEWARSLIEPPFSTAIILDSDNERDMEKYAPFESFLRSLFDFEIEVLSRYVGIWRNDSISTTDSRFCRGFPHRHNNDLTACSVVVQEPEAGGYAWFGGDLYEPKAGCGLLIGGREDHGVMRIIGPRPRIAMIAQFDRR